MVSSQDMQNVVFLYTIRILIFVSCAHGIVKVFGDGTQSLIASDKGSHARHVLFQA
jgi:hypothetical protein